MNDREWDKRLKIRTIGREDESNPNYAPYEPTPYEVLKRVAESGYIRRRQHVLDYGCGKGRVAFFLADAVGCRATGIDQSQKLIDLAVENRRTARSGSRVRLERGLAEQYLPGLFDIARGDTLTWTGGSATSDNFSDAANWSPAQSPASGDTLVFKVDLLAPVRHGVSSMKRYVFVGDHVVTEASFTAQIVKNK